LQGASNDWNNMKPLHAGLMWRMLRPGFLSITAVGCLLGFATAAACGHAVNPATAGVTLLLALLAHGGANVLNDYHDAISGADAANQQGVFPFTGGSRLIQTGLVSVSDTRLWGWTLLGLSALGGVWLTVQVGGGLLVIGLTGLLIAWCYSAPPLQLMSRGLGEFAVAAAWWLVVVGADYSQRGQFFIIPAWVGVSFALLVSNILLVNGLPDAEADARVGKRTLATRLGKSGVAWMYLVICVAAHAWVAWGVSRWIHPSTAMWSMVSAPVCLLACGWLFKHARNATVSLQTPIVLTIVAAHLHGLALAVGALLPHL